MPRSDRGLRRSYFLRQIVEGDVVIPHEEGLRSENLSSHQPKADFYPVNFYQRERVRDFSRSPKRITTSNTIRSSSPEVLKSSKKITWNASGDSVRRYSPERSRPHSADYIINEKPSSKQDHPRTKKKIRKPRSKSEERVNAERQKEKKRRELSAERRRIGEAKLKQEVNRRRKMQEDLDAAKRRGAAKRESRENSKKFNQKKTRGQSVPKPIVRSNSMGNYKRHSIKSANNSSVTSKMRHAKSSGEIRFHQPKRSNAPKMKKPRWNYVGDPTRKAFNTKVHHVVSDFYF